MAQDLFSPPYNVAYNRSIVSQTHDDTEIARPHEAPWVNDTGVFATCSMNNAAQFKLPYASNMSMYNLDTDYRYFPSLHGSTPRGWMNLYCGDRLLSYDYDRYNGSNGASGFVLTLTGNIAYPKNQLIRRNAFRGMGGATRIAERVEIVKNGFCIASAISEKYVYGNTTRNPDVFTFYAVRACQLKDDYITGDKSTKDPLDHGVVVFNSSGAIYSDICLAGNPGAGFTGAINDAFPIEALVSNTGVVAVNCVCMADGVAHWLGWKNGLYKLYNGSAPMAGVPNEKVTIKGHDFVSLGYGPYYMRIN